LKKKIEIGSQISLKIKKWRNNYWNERNEESKGYIVIRTREKLKEIKRNRWKSIKIRELKVQGVKDAKMEGQVWSLV
jgi:hypothetical protein